MACVVSSSSRSALTEMKGATAVLLPVYRCCALPLWVRHSCDTCSASQLVADLLFCMCVTLGVVRACCGPGVALVGDCVGLAPSFPSFGVSVVAVFYLL